MYTHKITLDVYVVTCVDHFSSVGNGGFSAFLRNCAVTKAIPYTTFPLNGKLNGNNHWI